MKKTWSKPELIILSTQSTFGIKDTVGPDAQNRAS
jgi:hypothetical protein